MSRKWERRERLLNVMSAGEEISVEKLSGLLDVSPSTVRRDLDALERDEIVVRTHGGVILHHGYTVWQKPFEERLQIAKEEKMRIAEALNKMIPDNCSLLLDSSTTCYYLAKLLAQRSGLTIATNSLKVAQLIDATEKNSIFLAGGEYRLRNHDCVGDGALEYFSHMFYDYLVAGANEVVPGKGFFDRDCRAAAVTRMMVKSAKHVFMALDSSKFQRTGNFMAAAAMDVQTLVMDSGISAEQKSLLEKEPYELVFC